MITGRTLLLLAALGALATACNATAASAPPEPVGTVTATTPTATTLPASTTSTTSTTTTSTTTTSTSSTTTTTTEPPLDVYDPACVVKVKPGDSLLAIAARYDDENAIAPAILAENGLSSNTIYADQLLDICVDNGLNDITGEQFAERNPVVVARDVVRQQEKLNELFDGLGIRALQVDGVSGPVTRQRLCAARLALGLPVSTEDMVGGSEEEQALMAAAALPIPFTSAILSERWILIDRTCQIMFVGRGADELAFVFPTSTGQPGYETRNQDLSRAFRFNPASDNGGWHNSTSFPAAEDNPLNGNMYKPLYFDNGQAIHGANSVPTSPASKGCARLRVEHQDMLVWWLGLADSAATYNVGRINVTVNVQGTWVSR